MLLTMAAAAIRAAEVQGAVESVQYWDPVTGAWVTAAPVGVPFGSLIGAKANMRNTYSSDQIMHMEFLLHRPDTSVKGSLVAPEVILPPNGIYEQGLRDYGDQPGIWQMVITLYGEEVPMVYVETYTAEYSLPAAGWNVWDLSAIVPVGTKVVELHAYSYGAGGSYFLDIGARKYGSSLARVFPPPIGYSWVGVSRTLCCEVSADRKIEVYQASIGANIKYRVIGYIA